MINVFLRSGFMMVELVLFGVFVDGYIFSIRVFMVVESELLEDIGELVYWSVVCDIGMFEVYDVYFNCYFDGLFVE